MSICTCVISGNGVAVVTINRPEARNALNTDLRRALAARFTALSEDGAVRAVVLTGSANCFAAGADLRENLACEAPADIIAAEHQRLWEAISSCPKPVIAAVNGFALGGGCELAMHADIIIAGEGAKFGQPEVKLGLMPGAGGTQRLLRAVGKFQAMRLCLLGVFVTAAEALSMGLVSEVVPDGDVRARALAVAETVAAMPPLAVRQIKEAILYGQDASLSTGLAFERKAFHLLFSTEDRREGVRAFLEKRVPSFTGK